MRSFRITLVIRFIALVLLTSLSPVRSAVADAQLERWTEAVRQTPYRYSLNFYRNLSIIRTWVLLSTGFCEKPDRHILFDNQGIFKGYLNNRDDEADTQQAINQLRKKLAAKQKEPFWAEGSLNDAGYPFALACDQPHVDLQESAMRMLGPDKDVLIWGSWDGLKVGDKDKPVPLYKAFIDIYETRKAQGRYSFPDSIMREILGQVLIESGGLKNSRSVANANGIMQLRTTVLKDCGVPKQYYLHRMAQIDCALKLYQQNHRNLEEPFNALFGKLPEKKRNALYGLLLIQAYHGGVGRITRLLNDEELNQSALYFSSHHQSYSAEDIALGMVYHNMGRDHFGLASLFYLVDVAIASDKLCAHKALKNLKYCAG
ncbi:hypothetical protein [Hahella sp. HN01]|uniref:hypothetical protein n=1 Tax=Hahella sp. HN01 TaxID=2847262 RepID=UPI001C1ED89C|nr:hypothetical protein [Hahella sp. HN01]MBU6953198.1 hypothetical protein [Hahella sp. HN01]